MNCVTWYKISFAISTRQQGKTCFSSYISIYINKSGGRKNMIASWACVCVVFLHQQSFHQHFVHQHDSAAPQSKKGTFLYTQQLVFIMDSVIKHLRWDRSAKINSSNCEMKRRKSLNALENNSCCTWHWKVSFFCVFRAVSHRHENSEWAEIENR